MVKVPLEDQAQATASREDHLFLEFCLYQPTPVLLRILPLVMGPLTPKPLQLSQNEGGQLNIYVELSRAQLSLPGEKLLKIE